MKQSRKSSGTQPQTQNKQQARTEEKSQTQSYAPAANPENPKQQKEEMITPNLIPKEHNQQTKPPQKNETSQQVQKQKIDQLDMQPPETVTPT
ncbi:hypothetical protein [Lysinibacillus fusiformis]|uniref:hypothetical protein n=1 Tax=Lysinibacillus fusiformis TaxID=28031 RepID=UPI0008E269B0|nr:hypothetical protein [Lysinibacillus fusiformis]SFS35073.1 hypothetical protein SAMN02787099_00272 [Lysinibacillus fusiformis]